MRELWVQTMPAAAQERSTVRVQAAVGVVLQDGCLVGDGKHVWGVAVASRDPLQVHPAEAHPHVP